MTAIETSLSRDPHAYLGVHVGYELKCLLAAATCWDAMKHRPTQERQAYLIDFAQDSAFLHARNLFDLFTKKEGRYNRMRRAYGVERAQSGIYKAWKKALHDKNLHMSPDRPFSTAGESDDDLPEQVLVFAREIVRLWNAFAANSKEEFRPDIAAATQLAMRDCEEVARSYGATVPDFG